jgi:MOSC domain-containing protein YiiM
LQRFHAPHCSSGLVLPYNFENINSYLLGPFDFGFVSAFATRFTTRSIQRKLAVGTSPCYFEVMAGQIYALSVSAHQGTAKVNIARGRLYPDWGLVGDAHAGPGHRQLSLLSWEDIQAAAGHWRPGDFAENITTQNIDLGLLKVGDQLKIGEQVLLEITQLGKKCHSHCEIFRQVGDCIMPRRGIFAKILQGGEVRADDPIQKI